MRKTLVFIILAALLLAACATLPGQDTTSPDIAPDLPYPSPTEMTLPPSGAGSDKPSQVALPEGAVLEFRRSGGFAGLNEVWTLYADGRLTKADSDQPGAALRDWQVDPAQVSVLLEQIDGLGFFSLPAGGESQAPGADRFAYSLAVSFAGKDHRVSAAEGASGVPEAYWQVIAVLQSFLQEVPQ